jgi:imidazolonepropionase-like amidohydrolase
MRIRIDLLLIVAASLTACTQGDTTAYIGATVWDGTGGPPIPNAVIVVENGKIRSIGPAGTVAVPGDASEMYLNGKWVIPGLIDAHTHAERWTLTRFVAYGVTSLRDVGGPLDSVMALREDVELGSIPGPRMYVAGAMLDAPPAVRSGAIEVPSAPEARQAIDRLTLLGASLAKIYTGIDRPLLEAILDEATTLNLPVAAHLGKVDAITAAELGVSSIEHLTGVVEATARNPQRYFREHDSFFVGWNSTERAWAALDSAAMAQTAAAMAQYGTTIVPTLVLHEAWSRLTDQAYIDRLDLSGVPEAVQLSWDVPDLVRRAGITATDTRAFRRSRPYQDRFVRLYHRAGGKVAAGTDTPNQLLAPGASLHDELALLVRAGLEPADALLAATREAAQLVSADSIGILTTGAVADFVILNASPLADIANSRDIDLVVLRGTLYSPSILMERD